MRFAFLAMALLAGCASQDTAVITTGDRYVAPKPDEPYPLGIGDKVRLQVFGEQQMSGEFDVEAGGAVSLPLIGDVPAVGRTMPELIADVERRLAQGFVRNPHVSGQVTTMRPFYIYGEVSRPGRLNLESGMTLSSAVATAGGFTPRADEKIVFIRREGETEERAYRFSPALRIYPGDTVRIRERWF